MSKMQLSEVVGMFLDGNDLGNAEYSKAYRIAIRGWRKFNWDLDGVEKSVKLFVEPDLSAKLPDDCLAPLRVGVGNSNGTLSLLTRNDNLSLAIDIEQDEYDSGMFGEFNSSDDNFFNPIFSKSLGIGSVNNIGEYAIKNGRVMFPPTFCYREVVLEYNAKPNVDGEYLIDEMYSEALLGYVRWQWFLPKQGVALSRIQEFERYWNNEYKKAKIRKRNITEGILNDASRLNVKFAIKS